MTKIFVANWKMNKTVSEAKAFLTEFLPKVADSKNEIIIAANAVCLTEAQKKVKRSNVQMAAQNIYTEKAGAFTGEISAEMLKDIKVKITLLGHSERRIYFGEDDEFINKKVKLALNDGFKVILCIGENAEERDNKQTMGVLTRQLKIGLRGVTAEEMKNVYVAYEPIWSISTFTTGKIATTDEITEVHSAIKNILAEMYPKTYKDIKILYGGSVSPKNSKQIMKIKNVDGALIGGASLKVDSLVEVVK